MQENKTRILVWPTPGRWHYRIVSPDGKTVDMTFRKRNVCNLAIQRQREFHPDAEIVVLTEAPK